MTKGWAERVIKPLELGREEVGHLEDNKDSALDQSHGATC